MCNNNSEIKRSHESKRCRKYNLRENDAKKGMEENDKNSKLINQLLK